ncbi:tyrosine-protein phosphatase non-receptor type 2-like isoform X2 [Clavelina lepadiformis]|uniref:tyrosine-protein phosphatase non-receptor type 2-like isoform X2 n=1 Tax=Clavelina lepadiformis TaxID=159417 RepID=UPI004042EECA
MKNSLKMISINELVAVIEQQQGWDRLFREIKATSAAYELPCRAAKLQHNRNRNRYRDVSPFDHSRVRLLNGPSDYINSSLVNIEAAGRRYILSQGPLPGTSGHLWQMVWEQNSKSIIMLNKIIEKGARKCHQYWPLDHNLMSFPEEGFEVSFQSETDHHNFYVRELRLTETKTEKQESRIIYQFHYTAWPDFGVPESPTAFLDFLGCVREYGVLENDVGPAVIHCSAGIGRSGTFALVDTCLVFLEKGIPFDIGETLLEMRKDRMGLIQTPQQLRFSYFAIADCERLLSSRQAEDLGDEDESGSSSEDEDESGNPESISEEENAGEDRTPDEKGDDAFGDEDQQDDEPKENRKRHMEEPNGPADEKRGNYCPDATKTSGQETAVSHMEGS